VYFLLRAGGLSKIGDLRGNMKSVLMDHANYFYLTENFYNLGHKETWVEPAPQKVQLDREK
jgi:hypothetical protein